MPAHRRVDVQPHDPSRRRITPIAGVGSNAIDDVVPRVEQTKNGNSPAARSAAMISARAAGPSRTWRRGAPTRNAGGADAGDAEALLDARVRLGRRIGDEPGRVAVDVDAPPEARQRAERIATSVASLAEPWITPPPVVAPGAEPRGQVEQLPHPVEHQRLELGARGEVTQLMPCTPSPAVRLAEDRRVRGVAREVGEEGRVAAHGSGRERRLGRGRGGPRRGTRAPSVDVREARPHGAGLDVAATPAGGSTFSK